MDWGKIMNVLVLIFRGIVLIVAFASFYNAWENHKEIKRINNSQNLLKSTIMELKEE